MTAVTVVEHRPDGPSPAGFPKPLAPHCVTLMARQHVKFLVPSTG